MDKEKIQNIRQCVRVQLKEEMRKIVIAVTAEVKVNINSRIREILEPEMSRLKELVVSGFAANKKKLDDAFMSIDSRLTSIENRQRETRQGSVARYLPDGPFCQAFKVEPHIGPFNESPGTVHSDSHTGVEANERPLAKANERPLAKAMQARYRLPTSEIRKAVIAATAELHANVVVMVNVTIDSRIRESLEPELSSLKELIVSGFAANNKELDDALMSIDSRLTSIENRLQETSQGSVARYLPDGPFCQACKVEPHSGPFYESPGTVHTGAAELHMDLAVGGPSCTSATLPSITDSSPSLDKCDKIIGFAHPQIKEVARSALARTTRKVQRVCPVDKCPGRVYDLRKHFRQCHGDLNNDIREQLLLKCQKCRGSSVPRPGHKQCTLCSGHQYFRCLGKHLRCKHRLARNDDRYIAALKSADAVVQEDQFFGRESLDNILSEFVAHLTSVAGKDLSLARAKEHRVRVWRLLCRMVGAKGFTYKCMRHIKNLGTARCTALEDLVAERKFSPSTAMNYIRSMIHFYNFLYAQRTYLRKFSKARHYHRYHNALRMVIQSYSRKKKIGNMQRTANNRDGCCCKNFSV